MDAKSMNDYKRRVMDEVERTSSAAIELLQDLVRIPSHNPPGNEKAVADYCAAYLRQLGLEVQQIEPAPLRVSNVCRVNGSTGNPTLLFNSHLDTFPPGDEANWKHPPYAAMIEDGVMWGIGSKNMKAGLAAAMFAVATIRRLGVPLRGDILITHEADEIVLGDLGLKQLVESGLVAADYAVYTESDPPCKIEISHRGVAYFEVTTRGLAKHTKLKGQATPDGPVINAIAKMAPVIEAIEGMEFTNWSSDPHIPGPPIASVNMIAGGQAKNMSADTCSISVDCRFLPNQTAEQIEKDLRAAIRQVEDRDPLMRVEIKLLQVALPSAISEGEPIVTALKDAIREVTGQEMGVGGVSSTSDARWLILTAGIPTAKFEFQDSESGPNEHMAIADYLNTIKTYAVLALNLLS